jgi:hypothetical protein
MGDRLTGAYEAEGMVVRTSASNSAEAFASDEAL